MTNEEAIKILKELQDNLFHVDVSLSLHYDHILDEIINILRNQPKWIPCSKGLPNFGEPVLTTMDDETLELNHRFDFDGRQGWFWNDVVAWYPLPEPYKGGKE